MRAKLVNEQKKYKDELWEEFLMEVESILEKEYDLEGQEAQVFSQIADEELVDLFEKGVDPSSAAKQITDNEDNWDEFEYSKQEEEYEKERFDLDQDIYDRNPDYDVD